MLPMCGRGSTQKLQTLVKNSKTLHFITNSFKSLQSQMSSHPRITLFLVFLFLQVLVVFFARSVPLSSPIQSIHPSTYAGKLDAADKECASGRVYVYDLPPMFNRDLVAGNCDDLDPWKWMCGVVSNHGYGHAATELTGILPESLAPAWYRTNQFSSEIIFYTRMLNYKCRTLEPESAAAFYIPFYAGLAVGKYLWHNNTRKRDLPCERVLMWVQNQTYWKRSNGSDHFIALGRITWDFRRLTDPEKLWGSSFLNMPAMQDVMHFTIERAPWDDHDIGIPYPTGFHPSSDSEVRRWQNFVSTRVRNSLFTFIGATRGDIKTDFRAFLLSYCRDESGSCRVVDCAMTPCSSNASVALEALLDSDFCLQPKGDSFTRRSIFDCMVSGSIPVFFWNRTAYDQYEWFLPAEPESYSVFIDHENVRNGTSIRGVLERFSREKVRKMRERVIEIIPRIVYVKPNEDLRSFKDAFEIAVEGVLRRFKEHKQRHGLHVKGK